MKTKRPSKLSFTAETIKTLVLKTRVRTGAMPTSDSMDGPTYKCGSLECSDSVDPMASRRAECP